MHEDDTTQDAQLEALASPRPLREDEAELLRWFVADADLAGLDAQVGSAAVVATCTCGCPSVGLATGAPALAPEVIREAGGGTRDDWCVLTAEGTNDEDRAVQVSLHLVDGRIHELEVWAGTHGGPSVTAPPAASSLRRT